MRERVCVSNESVCVCVSGSGSVCQRRESEIEKEVTNKDIKSKQNVAGTIHLYECDQLVRFNTLLKPPSV